MTDEKAITSSTEKAKKSTSTADALLRRVVDVIGSADEEAIAERVNAWREAHPEATAAELVEDLIRQKTQRACLIGAATSSADVIPVVGTLATLTLGTVADISLTLRLQAELVLEIAAAHGHALSADTKREAILVVIGISTGVNRLAGKAAQNLSARAAERYAGRWVMKLVPGVGIAASAIADAVTTYVIGQRANAYFGRGPEAMGDWADSVRALSGLDERKIQQWLAGSACSSTARALEAANGIGQSLGEAAIAATRMVRSAATAAKDSAGTTAGTVTEAAQSATEAVSNHLQTATSAANDLARSTTNAAKDGMETVAGKAKSILGRVTGKAKGGAGKLLPSSKGPSPEPAGGAGGE